MAAPAEFYKSIQSVPIRGFTHFEVQGYPATTKGSPFRQDHIPQFSLASGNAKRAEVQSYPELIQISDRHCRSYQLGKETTVIWTDEFGNIFTKLNTKGNNCQEPKIYNSDIAPSGFLIWGIQDSDSMVRILRASSLMRQQHIETEAIIRVIEPAELPMNGEVVLIPQFKQKLLQDIWEEDPPEDEKDEKTGYRKVIRRQIPDASKAIHDEKMTFFISIRGVQVNERLRDMDKIATADDFNTLFSNAFTYVNTDERMRARRGEITDPQTFSVDKPEDIERYLTDYLPRKIARNYAKLHALGLIHVYPHRGNITTVGSIVDLDSVKGKPLGLGDEAITRDDISIDIAQILVENDGFANLNAFLPGDDAQDRKRKFAEAFLDEYSNGGQIISEISKKFITDLLCEGEYDINPIDLFLFVSYFLNTAQQGEGDLSMAQRAQVRTITTSILSESMIKHIFKDYQDVSPNADELEESLISHITNYYVFQNLQKVVGEINDLIQNDQLEDLIRVHHASDEGRCSSIACYIPLFDLAQKVCDKFNEDMSTQGEK